MSRFINLPLFVLEALLPKPWQRSLENSVDQGGAGTGVPGADALHLPEGDTPEDALHSYGQTLPVAFVESYSIPYVVDILNLLIPVFI